MMPRSVEVDEKYAQDLLKEKGVLVDICDGRRYSEIALSLGLVSTKESIPDNFDAIDDNIDDVAGQNNDEI